MNNCFFSRGIACFVACMHLWTLYPYDPLISERKSAHDYFNTRLDNSVSAHDYSSWKEFAYQAMEETISLWETKTIHYRESSRKEWEQEKESLIMSLTDSSNREYLAWAVNRYFEDKLRVEGSLFAQNLRDRAIDWKYEENSNGVQKFTDIVSPDKVLDARKQWNENVCESAIQQWLSRFSQQFDVLSGESSDWALSMNINPQAFEQALRNGGEEYQKVAASVYERCARFEENALIARLLYDRKSIKKESLEQSAQVIASQITDEVLTESNQAVDLVFRQFNAAVEMEGAEEVQIQSDKWIESFSSTLDSALEKWEDAEKRFLIERSEWEKQAGVAFLDTQAQWDIAYDTLQEAKRNWIKNIEKQFEEGVAKWSESEVSLVALIDAAKTEFSSITEKNRERLERMIDTHIQVYTQGRDMVEIALSGLGLWYERWGERYNGVYAYWKTEDHKASSLYSEQMFSAGEIAGVIGYVQKTGYVPTLINTNFDVLSGQLLQWKTGLLSMIKNEYFLVIERIDKDKDWYNTKKLITNNAILVLKGEMHKFYLENATKPLYYKLPQYVEMNTRLQNLESQKSEYEYQASILSGYISKLKNYEERTQGMSLSGITGKDLDVIVNNLKFSCGSYLSNLALPGSTFDAANDLLEWVDLSRHYKKQADDAVEALYSGSAGVYKSFIEDDYLDELSLEIIKANSAHDYWMKELEIAKAVEEYSINNLSSVDTRKITENNLLLARQEYEQALALYDSELLKIEALQKECVAAENVVVAVKKNLEEQRLQLERTRKQYSEVLLSIAGVGDDIIKKEIAQKLIELQQCWNTYKEVIVDKSSSYYQIAKEVGIIENRQRIANFIEILLNGGTDEHGISLASVTDLDKVVIELDNSIGESPEEQYELLLTIATMDEGLRTSIENAYLMYLGGNSEEECLFGKTMLSRIIRSTARAYERKALIQQGSVRFLLTGSTGFYSETDDEVQLMNQLQAIAHVEYEQLQDYLLFLPIVPEVTDDATEEDKNKREQYLAEIANINARIEAVSLILTAGTLEEINESLDAIESNTDLKQWIIDVKSGHTALSELLPSWTQLRYEEFLCTPEINGKLLNDGICDLIEDYLPETQQLLWQKSLESVNALLQSTDVENLSAVNGSLFVWINSLRRAGGDLSFDGMEAVNLYAKSLIDFHVLKDIHFSGVQIELTSEQVSDQIQEENQRGQEIMSWGVAISDISLLNNLLESDCFITYADEQTLDAAQYIKDVYISGNYGSEIQDVLMENIMQYRNGCEAAFNKHQDRLWMLNDTRTYIECRNSIKKENYTGWFNLINQLQVSKSPSLSGSEAKIVNNLCGNQLLVIESALQRLRDHLDVHETYLHDLQSEVDMFRIMDVSAQEVEEVVNGDKEWEYVIDNSELAWNASVMRSAVEEGNNVEHTLLSSLVERVESLNFNTSIKNTSEKWAQIIGDYLIDQEKYYESACKEYIAAADKVSLSYSKYSNAVNASDDVYQLLEKKKTEKEKQEKIYEWAQSVYFDSLGSFGAKTRKTPKERLTECELQLQRSEISLNVLQSMISTDDPYRTIKNRDSVYEKAMNEYEEICREYYLSRALKYDIDIGIAQMEDEVRNAESQEYRARNSLVQEVDGALSPVATSSLNLVYLYQNPLTGSWNVSLAYEELKNGGFVKNNYPVTSEQDINNYFLQRSLIRKTVDGNEYQSYASSDALSWFIQVQEKSVHGEYLDQIAVASLYLKYCAYQNGVPGMDCAVAGVNIANESDFYLHGIPQELHGLNIKDIYDRARIKYAKAAYENLVSTHEGKTDLAKYILYRDSSFSFDFIELEKRAIDVLCYPQVEKDISKEAAIHNVNGAAAAASAAAFAVLAIWCPPFLIQAAAMTLISVTEFTLSRDFKDIEKDISNIRLGKTENRKQDTKDTKSTIQNWLEARRIAAEKTALLSMYYGKKNGEEIKYDDFCHSVKLILCRGTSAVKYKEFIGVCTKEIFIKTGAYAAADTTTAMSIVCEYFQNEEQNKQRIIENDISRNLVTQQQASLLSYYQSLEDSSDDDSDFYYILRGLSSKVSNENISAKEREEALQEYDILVEAKKTSTDKDLTKILTHYASQAYSLNSWSQRHHDRRLFEIHKSLVNQWTRFERKSEAYALANLVQLKNDILNGYDNSVQASYETKQVEWDIALADFERKKDEWYEQVIGITDQSRQEWIRAETSMNNAYASFIQKVSNNYIDKNKQWEASWDQFQSNKAKWISDQYLYAVAASAQPLATFSGVSVDAIIAHSLPDAQAFEHYYDNGIAAHEVVSEIIGSSVFSSISEYVNGLTGIARSSAHRIRSSIPDQFALDTTIARAEIVSNAISSEIRKASALLAANQASRQFALLRDSYTKTLKQENDYLRKYEYTMARNSGYSISNGIARDALISSTLMSNKRKKQTVHDYQDYTTSIFDDDNFSIDKNTLDVLDDWGVMRLISYHQNILQQQAEKVFGWKSNTHEVREWRLPRTYAAMTAIPMDSLILPDDASALLSRLDTLAAIPFESLSDVEKKEFLELNDLVFTRRDGSLGEHIGYAPVYKTSDAIDYDKGRDGNILYGGSGELGLIMADFIWNSIEAGYGYSELGSAPWYKKVWDDNGGFFQAPTIRQAVDIAVNAIGNYIGGPIGGFVLGIVDDAVFSQMDVAGGYRSEKDAHNELGQKVVGSAVSMAISMGYDKSGVSSSIAGSAMKGYTQGVASSYVSAYNFHSGSMNWDKGNSGWTSANSLGNALSSSVSLFVNDQLSTSLSNEDNKFYGGAVSLMGSLSGEMARYGVYSAYSISDGGSLSDAFYRMGGFSMNLLDLGAILDAIASSHASTNSTGQSSLFSASQKLSNLGLFEVTVGSSGVHGSLGSGGIAVGSALYDLSKRLSDKKRLYEYRQLSDSKGSAALLSYVYGDIQAETTARRLASGLDTLEFVDCIGDGSAFGLTISNDSGGRQVNIVDMGSSEVNSILLQHEAHRDGIVNSHNFSETISSVVAHTIQAKKLLEDDPSLVLPESILQDIQAYDKALLSGNMIEFVYHAANNYDSSGDYWRVNLDENGRVIQVRDDDSPDQITIVSASGETVTIKRDVALTLSEQIARINGDESPTGIKHINNVMWESGLNYTKEKGWHARNEDGIYHKSYLDYAYPTTSQMILTESNRKQKALALELKQKHDELITNTSAYWVNLKKGENGDVYMQDFGTSVKLGNSNSLLYKEGCHLVASIRALTKLGTTLDIVTSAQNPEFFDSEGKLKDSFFTAHNFQIGKVEGLSNINAKLLELQSFDKPYALIGAAKYGNGYHSVSINNVYITPEGHYEVIVQETSRNGMNRNRKYGLEKTVNDDKNYYQITKLYYIY